MHSKLFKFALVIAFLFTLLPVSSFASGSEGTVRFAMRTGSWFDPYTDNPSVSTEQWLNAHFWRMQTTSPYFDSRLSWFPNALAYIDLYGVPVDSPLAVQHPDWFLKDSNGDLMFIPFACNGTTCTQYAADPGNAEFRAYWISQAQATLKKGYKGVWIDDVNLAFRVGNGAGKELAPYDPRTGTTMTITNWMQYVADFTKAIRTALPNYQIVHNSIWFAGPERQSTPQVIEEIQQADIIDCERGVSDSGLTGGTGTWSLNALFGFVDAVHALGKSVMYDEYTLNGEYGLAGYFMTNNGTDAEGDQAMTPNNWWAGYDLNLGTAQGARYSWNTLLRRDFSGGMALMNLPKAATVTVTLPHAFTRVDGTVVTQVTLAAGQGAILMNPPMSPIQINAGGSATGSFAADKYVSGGSTAKFSEAVAVSATGAAPMGVYQTKRTSFSSFTYTIPGLNPSEIYTVKLHFADDMSNHVGQRVFNVAINGQTVLSKFDIFAAAGSKKLTAVVQQFSAAADATGQITIEFTAGSSGAALVSGLEVE